MVDFDTVRSVSDPGDTVADCLEDGLKGPTSGAMDEESAWLDLRYEEHRLWTLRYWPPDWARELARLGFCSVSQDREAAVRCVFCGREVTNFCSPRDAQVLHWQSGHLHCPFLGGEDVGNVPLPHHRPNKTPTRHSTGRQQVHQCVGAGTTFPKHNRQENISGDPRFGLTAPPQGMKTVSNTTSAPTATAGSKSTWSFKERHGHLTEMVRTARYPAMAAFKARLDTFDRWPLLKPSPKELARAGFFQVEDSSSLTQGGRGDTVKCFWCAERIHRWQRTDDALLEHARLSPDCLFVASLIGEQLRDDIVHVTGNDVTRPAPCQTRQQPERLGTTDLPPSPGRQQPSTLTPSQLEDLMRTPAVQTVLQMGFPCQLIRNLLSHNSQRLSADTLCHLALQAAEHTSRAPPPPPPASSAVNGSVIPHHADTMCTQSGEDPKPEQGQGSGFQERGMCKVCSEAEVKVLFRPCNHLVCCSRCTALFTSCPLCHQVIEDVLDVYLT